ncbi:putative membrane protein [Natranaerovirga pectinivora]|uniref:Putative membrane protein n=1 Tax=Natranaerovirga pectinivora TaxID=682400 RepID=A0A4R3MHH2_9FIRM|nr:QueT transporter family protein [Natranaerovirga pectinivora]TCT13072.1 putative membrane protein [Natranaerovirga pectinivora]
MDNKARYITQAAIIAAIYVVVTIVFQAISFREIQIRISEALTILPYFTPAAIPGLFIGCLIANYLGGAMLADIILGSLATLLAAILSYSLRKNRYLVPIPPIIINAIVVGFLLKYVYGFALPLISLMILVAIGQFISCFILGLGLIYAMEKYKLYRHIT